MERFRSHKTVEAAKIIYAERTESGMLIGAEGEREEILVTEGPVIHKLPSELLGGYLVRYEDGYMSWSPAKAFEEGYTLLPTKD